MTAAVNPPKTVLVVNAGSSSMKYQLIDVVREHRIAGGLAERIGEPSGRVSLTTDDGVEHVFEGPVPDHAVALSTARTLFADAGIDLADGLVAVGHRVVHGGARFGGPVVVDAKALDIIKGLSALAPLHNPANVTGIEQAMTAFPDVPQVAIFDTAFFLDLPAAAATYAIDRAVAEEHRIRRYGFHGTSHQYVSGKVSALLGRDDLRQVVLHLGNGASVSAVRAGRAVETSMGLTPLEGLVMGTRSGDLDPGVLLHLARNGWSVEDLDTLLNRRSGVFGLSGVADFRDLQARADDGDEDAGLALDVFAHRVRKYVGAYLAILGGLDVITFTAGIGENSAPVRARCLAGLEGLGILLDPALNQAHSREPRVISAAGSPVTVMVVPTNEELAIAQQTVALVGA